MNDTNRRGFLSGFGAMLASLPIVGALFGKAEAKERSDYENLLLDYKSAQGENATLRRIWNETPKVRWIPVEERPMPTDKPGTFLIACEGGAVAFCTVLHAHNWSRVDARSGITHWAELPSPPTNGNGKA